MMRRPAKWTLLCCLVLMATSAIVGGPVGAYQISGVVLNREGEKVPGTTVCTMGSGSINGRLNCNITNANGDFALVVSQPGNYHLTAENTAEGYPNSFWAFYGKDFCDCPTVAVTDSDPKPTEIRLGPKAGRIIFTLVDADTGRPIERGAVRLSRVNEQTSSDWQLSTGFSGGKYELLAPAVPFSISFATDRDNESIPRFAFDESGRLLGTLQVDLGARKEMTIRLK